MTDRKWYPTKIDGNDMQEFADYLNKWADDEKHDMVTQGGKITAKLRGYHQAVHDIMERLGLQYLSKKEAKKEGVYEPPSPGSGEK